MKKIKNKNNLSEEFTNLFQEYSAIYNNMPIGSLTIKTDGTIKEYNSEGKRIIEKICNTPINSFNFLTSRIFIIDEDLSRLKNNKELEKKIGIKTGNSPTSNKLYIKLKMTVLEYNKEIYYLVLITDNTQITGQRKEIEDNNIIINKALVESNIGLCHLNLFDNKGFATKTWFDNLYVNNTVSIINSFVNIHKEDYENIENYIKEIKNIQFDENEYLAFAENNYRKNFNCNVKVKGTDGQQHYLRVYSEVSKYNPDEGEIIADFMTVNIDKQKERETTLEETYIKTKEAEELKQSFIVNMGNEIHTPLNTITLSCLQLFNKSNSREEKFLFEKIELNTNKLLKIISNVVNISKDKFNNGNVNLQKAPIIKPKETATTKTLLIAEDNENNYKLLKYMIKTKYKIIHALNGEEAIVMYKNLKPDAILMDIKMPIMDGYQATEIIRNIDNSVPIIAVTAYAFENDKNKILNSGFSDYISKPVNETELFKTLNKYL